jgi:hypothetical protein
VTFKEERCFFEDERWLFFEEKKRLFEEETFHMRRCGSLKRRESFCSILGMNNCPLFSDWRSNWFFKG